MFNANGDVEQEGNWNNDVFVVPAPSRQYQSPASYVQVPPLVKKLHLGMTKNQVLKILGKRKYPSGTSTMLIDTKKDRWDYYFVDIFEHIWIVFDAPDGSVDFIGFAVLDAKLAAAETLSNNMYRIQKGQTMEEMLSILGYPDEISVMRFIENYGDLCASYYDKYYEYDIFFSNGTICMMERYSLDD